MSLAGVSVPCFSDRPTNYVESVSAMQSMTQNGISVVQRTEATRTIRDLAEEISHYVAYFPVADHPSSPHVGKPYLLGAQAGSQFPAICGLSVIGPSSALKCPNVEPKQMQPSNRWSDRICDT